MTGRLRVKAAGRDFRPVTEETISILTRSLNIAVVFVLAVGLLLRHRPKNHMPLMLTAFVGDLGNVLLIELSLGAGEPALDAFTSGGYFVPFHVSVSVLAIVGYMVAVVSGMKLYRASRSAAGSPAANPERETRLRQVHKVNAGIFIVMRLASFVTSFWM